ncbi:hypothetical protein KFE96_16240 [Kordiimonas sp. SCSIO 12603]|uniref:hypothetical protein n=1 Tax=Kordiimonas sp. SCSIO 12603 TaxID=2829596 RepID=UPI002102239B|nr:hypothetical protein [Kordiimonas sp. SCSIO 12603]UTW58350.1 hypothetical protein KFE96_16240 [Kordiimonas sp. SCSIO 12603]
MPRREKKSESLEIRLEYSKKTSFMEACKARGQTASDVLRGSIEEYITGPENRFPVSTKSLSIAALLAAGISLAAFYEQPASEPAQMLLSALDTNADAYLTATDARDESRKALFMLLENADQNVNGRVTAQELDTLNLKSIRLEDSSGEMKPVFLNLERKDFSEDRIVEELAKAGMPEKARETLSRKLVAMVAED